MCSTIQYPAMAWRFLPRSGSTGAHALQRAAPGGIETVVQAQFWIVPES
jgi:hypothetical protein